MRRDVVRFLSFFLVVVAASALLGCGAPWVVVKQAAPSPFANQKKFAVLPIDYSGLRVGDKSEAEYAAGKDGDANANWAGDKAGINDEFTRVLIEEARAEGLEVVPATGPGTAPFEIRPSIAFIEPGFYAYAVAKSSEVKMTIRLTAPDGAILDEIQIQHGTAGSMTNPAAGNRLRDDGEALGELAAKYLKTRVYGE